MRREDCGSVINNSVFKFFSIIAVPRMSPNVDIAFFEQKFSDENNSDNNEYFNNLKSSMNRRDVVCDSHNDDERRLTRR